MRNVPLNYKKKYRQLAAQYTRDIDERDELLKLIRDDLKMRSDDGVVDISNFIWVKLNNILEL